MATIYKLQASGVMFQTLGPAGWAFVFGVHVTDENDLPVIDLKQDDFSIFDMSSFSDIPVDLFNNIGVDLPATNLKGIYRLQTPDILGDQAPAPQQFLFALKASRIEPRSDREVEGETTVAITYLGPFH